MEVKPVSLAVVVLAALMIVAAGAGAYLAVRQSQSNLEVAGYGLGPNIGTTDAALPGSAVDKTAPISATSSDDTGTGDAVDATEEVIDRPAAAIGLAGTDDRGPAENRSQPSDQPRPSTTPTGTSPAVGSSDSNSLPRPRQSGSASSAAGPGVDHTSSRDGQPRTPAGWVRAEREDTSTRRPTAPQPSPSQNSGTTTVSTDAERVSLRVIDPASVGVPLAPEARPRIVEELVISADSVIGLQVDTFVSTDDAQIEDSVAARVTRDVIVDDKVAIAAGAQVFGSVVLVEQAGQFKGSSRLGVRFHTVVVDNIVDLPISTETVYREGEGRGNKSAAKIGGAAIGGAILGAIFGGGQGAAIGGAAGAAGGTAAAMAGNGEPATLRAGQTLTVRLSRPATVTLEY